MSVFDVARQFDVKLTERAYLDWCRRWHSYAKSIAIAEFHGLPVKQAWVDEMAKYAGLLHDVASVQRGSREMAALTNKSGEVQNEPTNS